MGKYYQTKESVEEYIKAAEGFNGSQIIEELLKFLPAHSDVLEIGSGPGTDWQILKQHYNITGSDNSPEFLNHLNVSFPDGVFLLLDASTILCDLRFDGVYSNKVLHHLEDEALEASIKRQAEILNPGGIVCHTFWRGEDSETFNGLFVNYHTDTGLNSMFGEHFDPLLMKFYPEFEEGDSILYIGKKKKEPSV